jgi:hypothetical protein
VVAATRLLRLPIPREHGKVLAVCSMKGVEERI